MFEEIKMRGKVAKYLAQEKKISPVQVPVEVEKCMQSLQLWCSRFCKDKEHNDRVMEKALEELLLA